MDLGTKTTKRSAFSGKLGFVLAAAGSAVGLGNIWRFPYLAAQYGGGVFLLVYIALSVTFGFSLMIAEIAIGRKTGKSAIEAYGALDKRFSFLGFFAAAVPMIILPYYSVIGGWVLKYMIGFISGSAGAMATDGYFNGYIGNTVEPLIWFLLFIGVTALIVLFGVEKGIEKVSKLLMPVLVLLTLFIALYSIFALDGAWEGVKYYIMPDFTGFTFEKVVKTVVAAASQLFYSMSLAMGIMITFGSYMKKDVSIEKSVKQIELFDTGVAFLAGLMIIPAVFAFSGGDQEALGQGPGLMFVTLPKVFDFMPGGTVIGAIFFFMVLLAALTSSISLMETIVSIFMDKAKLNRKLSCLLVFGISVLLGIPSAFGFSIWSEVLILGMDILTFFDFASNSIMMPIIAFITCIFVGYVLKPGSIEEEVEIGVKFKWKRLYHIVIRYVAPVFILAILISAILGALGLMKI